jgi:hypothetical protein
MSNEPIFEALGDEFVAFQLVHDIVHKEPHTKNLRMTHIHEISETELCIILGRKVKTEGDDNVPKASPLEVAMGFISEKYKLPCNLKTYSIQGDTTMEGVYIKSRKNVLRVWKLLKEKFFLSSWLAMFDSELWIKEGLTKERKEIIGKGFHSILEMTASMTQKKTEESIKCNLPLMSSSYDVDSSCKCMACCNDSIARVVNREAVLRPLNIYHSRLLWNKDDKLAFKQKPLRNAIWLKPLSDSSSESWHFDGATSYLLLEQSLPSESLHDVFAELVHKCYSFPFPHLSLLALYNSDAVVEAVLPKHSRKKKETLGDLLCMLEEFTKEKDLRRGDPTDVDCHIHVLLSPPAKQYDVHKLVWETPETKLIVKAVTKLWQPLFDKDPKVIARLPSKVEDIWTEILFVFKNLVPTYHHLSASTSLIDTEGIPLSEIIPADDGDSSERYISKWTIAWLTLLNGTEEYRFFPTSSRNKESIAECLLILRMAFMVYWVRMEDKGGEISLWNTIKPDSALHRVMAALKKKADRKKKRSKKALKKKQGVPCLNFRCNNLGIRCDICNETSFCESCSSQTLMEVKCIYCEQDIICAASIED